MVSQHDRTRVTVGRARHAGRARRTAATTAGLALLAVVGLTACDSGSTAPGGQAGGATGSSSAASGGAPVIEVKQFTFGPMNLTVPAGTKVTWKFDDAAKHNVKAKDGSFTSPDLNNGQTYSFTFAKPGKYDYICSIHQYMTGTVTVT